MSLGCPVLKRVVDLSEKSVRSRTHASDRLRWVATNPVRVHLSEPATVNINFNSNKPFNAPPDMDRAGYVEEEG